MRSCLVLASNQFEHVRRSQKPEARSEPEPSRTSPTPMSVSKFERLGGGGGRANDCSRSCSGSLVAPSDRLEKMATLFSGLVVVRSSEPEADLTLITCIVDRGGLLVNHRGSRIRFRVGTHNYDASVAICAQEQ